MNSVGQAVAGLLVQGAVELVGGDASGPYQEFADGDRIEPF